MTSPIGRVLSRREAVRLLGTGSAAAAFFGLAGLGAADAWQTPGRTPGCVVRPEQTEGPYFVDQQLNRPDIRSEPSTGMRQARRTAGARADRQRRDGRSVPPARGRDGRRVAVRRAGRVLGRQDGRVGFNTVGQKFLRGVQTTNAKGLALFTTIYPGWYPGGPCTFISRCARRRRRRLRVHVAVVLRRGAEREILADSRYAKPGRRDTTNATDSIYRNGGDQLLLAPTATADGLAASYAIGLDLADAAVGRADGDGTRKGAEARRRLTRLARCLILCDLQRSAFGSGSCSSSRQRPSSIQNWTEFTVSRTRTEPRTEH